jgi:hypothetical protein
VLCHERGGGGVLSSCNRDRQIQDEPKVLDSDRSMAENKP